MLSALKNNQRLIEKAGLIIKTEKQLQKLIKMFLKFIKAKINL